MNLGRFHAAIRLLWQEYEQSKIPKLLGNLQSTLQSSISTPNAQTAQAFKEHYAALVTALHNSKSNKAYPTQQKVFEEISADAYIGIGLANRIATLFSENQITPANALAELQELAQKVNQFFERIKAINDAFIELKIEREELKPGEFEIGMSLPKDVIGHDLKSLENELHDLDLSLRTLQEVAGAGAGSISVKTISSSEWQFYLDVIPTVAAGLAIAVERIVALYKNNLEIKTLKKGLEEKQIPDSLLKGLQQHIEDTVRSEIRQIAGELVEQYYKNDDQGRKNELITQTSHALRYIADRIDRGATIEVHAEPPEKPEGGLDETNKAVNEAGKSYLELKKLALFVNEKSSLTARLARSDQPVLAIEFDKKDNK